MPRFDRLNQWANFLDDLPHRKFHMAWWCSRDRTEASCGTSGCAAGWAVTLFHKEGLYFDTHGGGPRLRGLPNGHALRAIENFFDIPYTEADLIACGFDEYFTLFGVRHVDITPHMAAEMIRKVIRKLGGEVTEDYPVLDKTVKVTS